MPHNTARLFKFNRKIHVVMLGYPTVSQSNELQSNSSQHASEDYKIYGDFAVRNVILQDGRKVVSKIVVDAKAPKGESNQSIFEYSYLRLKSKLRVDFGDPVFVADLFCGCGGLSLGALEACNAIGRKFVPLFAADRDAQQLSIYERNFSAREAIRCDLSEIINGHLGSTLTESERKLKERIPALEGLGLLLAGPPCQGYSSLNNYTRQKDVKNALYDRVARFVEIFNPENILIENVPTVVNCEENVVEKSLSIMRCKGYSVDSDFVNLADIGVPQLRKRHLLVASKKKQVSIRDTVKRHRIDKHYSVAWAIDDLQDELPSDLMSTPTLHSEENKKRIEFLYSTSSYDLPNDLRPTCHQKKHGYKSMYGRMRFDRPAQTITSGFLSPGQGRFIHPTRTRTITLHEAARLQLFPDYFDFGGVTTRRSLSVAIGNAVPMKVAEIFCFDLLT